MNPRKGIVEHEKRFITWMIEQCSKPKVKPHDIFTEDAISLLAQRLISPLQIIYYAWRALEAEISHLNHKPKISMSRLKSLELHKMALLRHLSAFSDRII